MKILILGGYGVFGGRLAWLLADLPQVELLICGRDLRRAQAICLAYTEQARVTPCAIDRADMGEALRSERPDLVVDASGPFQDYGADRYHVVASCIDAGVDYLDFADAADFVSGISQLDPRALAAGTFALSGVSAFPVLTAAVLREMSRDFTIEEVEGGIAPSPFARIGLNVMRAVIGYAGSPVKLSRGGRPAQGIGLAESRRMTIAVPGKLPLRNLRFSLVDVPDLRLIPREFPAITDIWMGAGPVPEILHRMLNLLARSRTALRLPSLEPFAPLFYAVLNHMRFGEHRGGMFVRARGRASGEPVERSWHLLAEGDDGPLIPSMAVEAIVRKMLAGERPEPGARAAVHALELSDYAAFFANRRIFTGFRGEEGDGPLYPVILGSAFATLPAPLRQLHGSAKARTWRGHAEVRRGTGLVARIVAALVGFPSPGERVPVSVHFTPEGDAERWERHFGDSRFSSLQSRGTGRDSGLLVERFGPASFALALVVEDGRLFLVPRSWRLFGIPMPRALLPYGDSYEYERGSRFYFDVEVRLQMFGLVAAYRGSLEPD